MMAPSLIKNKQTDIFKNTNVRDIKTNNNEQYFSADIPQWITYQYYIRSLIFKNPAMSQALLYVSF